MSSSVHPPYAAPAMSSSSEPVAHHQPPYLLAAIAGLVVFALYAITLAPTTAFWDTSEYIATAHGLGIPHPPGNPLFVLMARAWELLLTPTGLSVAIRINLFSAVMSAGSAVFWFLVVHRILADFTPSETIRRVGAAAAVLVSATAFTVWNQSNVNEKVYTISFLTIAFVSWLAFLWRDHIEEHRGGDGRRWHDDNVLVLMVFLVALSSEGNHRMAFLVAPALFVLLLMVKPRVLPPLVAIMIAVLALAGGSWFLGMVAVAAVAGCYLWRKEWMDLRLLAASAVAGIAGLSVQLFLPIRAALGPVINEAAPVCPDGLGSAAKAILTFGRTGCEALASSLSREQYAKPPVGDRLAPFPDQIANYFQYFDWQWARSVQGTVSYLAAGRLPITFLFLALGAWGAWEHYRRDRKSFAYLATLFAMLSFGLVFYMNFRYGYGQAPALGLGISDSEVRERDYFYLISFSLWGLWVGVGITALWMRAMDHLRERMGSGRRVMLTASPVLLLAFIPLVLNWSYASRRGDYSARDWAYNLLQSIEPYGVVLTNGDNDTFPLWYLQEVEGIRRDVTVIVRSYLNTEWYARQIRDLTTPCPTPEAWRRDETRIICQRSFEPSKAPAFYGNPAPPSRSALPLADAEISRIANSPVVLPSDAVFEARGIEAVIPGGTFVQPADQFVLAMIADAWGDRPIYFAATTNLHQELGLGDHVLRQGVAFKLVTPSEAARHLEMPGDHPYSPLFGSYFDVERNRQLLGEIFIYRDLIDKPHWTEPATRGIPTYYAYALLAQAQAEGMLGNEARADSLSTLTQRWLDLSER